MIFLKCSDLDAECLSPHSLNTGTRPVHYQITTMQVVQGENIEWLSTFRIVPLLLADLEKAAHRRELAIKVSVA